MSRVWEASYERGVRLVKAGYTLPYLQALPGEKQFHQRGLYVSQLGGYVESIAVDDGFNTGYVVALRVGTNRSAGAVIASYEFVQPWPDQEIEWQCEPEDVIPQSKLHIYKKLMRSRLTSVLNEGRLLNRGRPVDGLLCGIASTPIPPNSDRIRPAWAEITLVDDSGKRVTSLIELAIHSNVRERDARRNASPRSGSRSPLFPEIRLPRDPSRRQFRGSSRSGIGAEVIPDFPRFCEEEDVSRENLVDAVPPRKR
jgi:hypothetical protein